MRDVRKFEIVIVGGGPAGLAAACAASDSGQRVALLDETPWLGGQIWRGQQAHPSVPEAEFWLDRLQHSKTAILDRCTVIGPASANSLLVEHPEGPREIVWERLILATGARELFLPFPGWTLPGNFGPGGLQSLAKHGWPIANKKIVVAGSGPLLLAVAAGLRKMGARVLSVNEQAPWRRMIPFGLGLIRTPEKLTQAAGLKKRLWGVPFRCGTWVVEAEGKEHVSAVLLTNGRERWREECDFLACGFGLVPNVELPLALGCQLDNGFVQVDLRQSTTVHNVFAAGELTGIGGVESALVEGQFAGCIAAGREVETDLVTRRAICHQFRKALVCAYALRDEVKRLAAPNTLVCRCEDVPLEKMKDFHAWRDAKLQTRCGMGSCQGRVCGAAARELFGWGMESVRPPALPARVGSLMNDQTSR